MQPFSILPYFALVIRAISVLEGIALVGNPECATIDEAYIPAHCPEAHDGRQPPAEGGAALHSRQRDQIRGILSRSVTSLEVGRKDADGSPTLPHGGHDALDADAQEGLLAERHDPLLNLPTTTDLVMPQDIEYIQLRERASPTSLDLLESAGS